MKFRHLKGALGTGKADLLVFGVFGDPTSDDLFKLLDTEARKLIRRVAKQRRFVGKATESFYVSSDGSIPAKYVAVLGMGKKELFKPPRLRDHAARAAAIATHLGSRSVVFALPLLPEESRGDAVQYAVEGALLGCYKFDKYRTRDKKPNPITSFAVMPDPTGGAISTAETREFKACIQRAEAVAAATCRARDFVNEPAGFLTPTRIAEQAQAMAKEHGLAIKVLNRRECEKLGMGMYLAVAQGSVEEPRFIHLTYKPKGKPASKVAIIGKGVMFDSGGYSLKPSSAMEDMKMDMSGAAAVISAMGAIAQIGSRHEIHGIAACCENLISGSAFKLRDVLHAMDGTTVEINNTDAEGRLTLGDAITYARSKIDPDEILDFATLTGACVVALGPYTAGVMSDTEDMVAAWLSAAERSGEDMWRLPLNKKLKTQLKSPIADMRNTGERWGGALTAGLFLQHFARDSRWVHVDLAGPAMASSAHGATQKGGTGFGVATIVEYLTRD